MPLLQILVVPADFDEIRAEGSEENKEMLKGWRVIELDSDQMVIELQFHDPKLVSQGEKPDLILISFQLRQDATRSV